MPYVHHRFWPKGLPHAIRIPQVSLTHYLEVAAARFPDKPAIVFGGNALTYARLRERVDALAGYLRECVGVQPGDRVLLLSQNCPQFTTAYYGIMRAGAVVVPVNAMSTTAELRYFIDNSGARVAICAQELLSQLQPLVADESGLASVLVYAYSDALAARDEDNDDGERDALPEVVRAPREALTATGLVDFEAALARGLAPPSSLPAADDLCVLPYTSGTTGNPKGCMHTHATMLASSVASQLWRGFHAESVFLAVAPLFHMLGMQNAMNLPITLGATVVMMPRWNPALAARLIERHRVSVWAAAPAMLIDFFAMPDAQQRDLHSLAVLSGGGAAMPESVAAMLQTRFGIVYNEAYGLTETASFLHANPLLRAKRQCLGVPTQSVESRVVDPVTLEELPPGELGELVTHGPQVMRGYWRDPGADRAAFFERDGKRFFRTGDLVAVDEDGYFFMRDRLKRMINASGYKVWPAEVENAMYGHPAVHEACVIGVADPRAGETVKALIVLKPEFHGQVSEQQIIDWSREHMAVYKAPRIVEFLERLPKSGTGKILWRELQDAHRNVPSR
ncbi:AMP-binding protein [Paraburkholderia sp. G-4-1-8]|uniref:AMP-binding protein n=2 Tax=Paraburkholderia antibiotica TaxID=2728839 RepID=A0A7X9ZY50_9BURK|nr:AMP-binding protein [Paraburkholderia antibiotica]